MSSKLRQTPFWEPIRGPVTTPIDNIVLQEKDDL